MKKLTYNEFHSEAVAVGRAASSFFAAARAADRIGNLLLSKARYLQSEYEKARKKDLLAKARKPSPNKKLAPSKETKLTALLLEKGLSMEQIRDILK